WSFTPPADLSDETHSITFSSVDAAGNEGPPSAPPTVTADATAPPAAPPPGRDDGGVARGLGPEVHGGVKSDRRLTFTGSGAEPDSTINVYDNGVLLGTAVADGAGNWSFTPDSDLSNGAHSITFSNVDAAGNEGPQSAAPFVFAVDTSAPAAAPALN